EVRATLVCLLRVEGKSRVVPSLALPACLLDTNARCGLGRRIAMTEANQPNLPGWGVWFTDRKTTRESLRRDAWFDILPAAVLSGLVALVGHFWWFTWKVAWIPVVWVVMGLWKFVAASWLDRNQAWERVTDQPQPSSGSRVGGSVLLLIGLLLVAVS